MWVEGLTWLETNLAGVDLRGELDETDSNPIARGTLSFDTCNSVYMRGSSLASIAGTYVDGGEMLAIDGQGGIVLQSGSCVGHGTVELIDSNFNMYRMELEVNACAGNELYVPETFSGLAYLGDSGPGFTGDLLEYSLSSGAGQRPLIWTDRIRRLSFADRRCRLRQLRLRLRTPNTLDRRALTSAACVPPGPGAE